ncbi:unnamed protein product [Ectocarpus sp. 6 AP-2014]
MAESGFSDDFLDPGFTDFEIANAMTRAVPHIGVGHGTQPTFTDCSDFNLATSSVRKDMFGSCDDPIEVRVYDGDGEDGECVSMESSRARRAMIRMMRRPVDISEIVTPTQKTGTCWFYSALTAMFLSDMGRVNNVPLRETMILGRKGYHRSSVRVPRDQIIPLRALNMVIHLFLDGRNVAVHGTGTELFARQNSIRETEEHLNRLRHATSLRGVRWSELFRNVNTDRWPGGMFGFMHPMAFIEGVIYMTVPGSRDDFMHVSAHTAPPPSDDKYTTIVRVGQIRGIHAAASDGDIPKTKLRVADSEYILDAMILTSDIVRDGVRHATACIHLNGTRYWFDSNDKTRPDPYQWYDLLDGRAAERTLGQTALKVKYSLSLFPVVFIYQKRMEERFLHIDGASLPSTERRKGGLLSRLKSVTRALVR